MVDLVIHMQGSINTDGTEIKHIPVRMLDNGDGSYSLSVSGGTGGGTTTLNMSTIPKHDIVDVINNASGQPTSVSYKLAGNEVLLITNTYDVNNFLTKSVRSVA